MALIDDAQGRDQFAAEIGAAPPVIGEGRQSRGHRVITHYPAEIALDPPQGDDKPRLDTKPAPDPVEQHPILSKLTARTLHALLRDDLVEILIKRQLAFRLLAI